MPRALHHVDDQRGKEFGTRRDPLDERVLTSRMGSSADRTEAVEGGHAERTGEVAVGCPADGDARRLGLDIANSHLDLKELAAS
ncbi:hypothetical protein [Agromyces humi]|uniref:hypothetical protein n=1 Tax=Agromyces humi TaxID=1766800 RepID=UPI00135B0161|nr:hypothetical protein [Agromyces humi]